MAKYGVKQFSVTIKNNNGYDYISLKCDLINSSGNTAKREYEIMTDTRQSDINHLQNIINNGFQYSQNIGAYVEIREFPQRNYLFITLPSANNKEAIQVSGRKV